MDASVPDGTGYSPATEPQELSKAEARQLAAGLIDYAEGRVKSLDEIEQEIGLASNGASGEGAVPRPEEAVSPTLAASHIPVEETLAVLEDVLRNDVKESDGAHWEYPESKLQALLDALTPKVSNFLAKHISTAAPTERILALEALWSAVKDKPNWRVGYNAAFTTARETLRKLEAGQ
jgi:hypothetical protein